MTGAILDPKEAIKAALRDPEYHARLLKKPLLWPQARIIREIERELADPRAQTVIVRSARQTTKNEVSARYQARHLLRNCLRGGNVVRAAPTFKPQIINSMLRLRDVLKQDPIAHHRNRRPRWRTEFGFIYSMGLASVTFLSADKEANVVGGTASHALDIDEAHIVDRGKYDEDFAPMAAWKGVPTLMWGVGAYQQDMLFEYIQSVLQAPVIEKEEGEGGWHVTRTKAGVVMEFPAPVWAELNPAYKQHYEARKATLGDDHPTVLTQYDLKDCSHVGGFFTPGQLDNLFSGAHELTYQPTRDGLYLAVLDVAGEADEEELARATATGQQMAMNYDGAVFLVAHMSLDAQTATTTWPLVEVVFGRIWVGEPIDTVEREVTDYLVRTWRPNRGLGDLRGVGAQIVPNLHRRWRPFKPYAATDDTVHDDCSNLIAMLNHGRLRMWRGEDEFHRQARIQCNGVQRAVGRHEKLKMAKPKRKRGDQRPRIDIPKALSYLARLAREIKPAEAPAGY